MLKKKLLEIETEPFNNKWLEEDSSFIIKAKTQLVKFYKNKRAERIYTADFYSKKTKKIEFRFFSNKKVFHVWDCKEKKWRKNRVCSYFNYHSFSDADKETNIITKNFFKKYITWHDTTNGIIDQYQSSLIDEAIEKARIAEKERLQRHINLFPSYPRDFKKYLKTVVFKDNKYIIYKSKQKGEKTRKGKCTWCNKEIEIPKEIRHKSEGICPKCKSKITYIHQTHIKSTDNKAKVSIAFKKDDMLLIKWLDVIRTLDANAKPYFKYKEFAWYIKTKEREYSYKISNDYYWGHAGEIVKSNYIELSDAYLYPNNLDGIFDRKKYNNVDIKKFAQNAGEFSLIRFLEKCERYKFIEYLIKMGLYNLAKNTYGLNVYGKNVEEILEISKQYIYLYKRFNITSKEHELIKTISSKESINPDKICTIRELLSKTKYHDNRTIIKLTKYMTVTKLNNYIKKQSKIYKNKSYSNLITTYNDYIGMCKQIGYDIESNKIKYPKKLIDKHDEIVKMIKIQQNKSKDLKIRQLSKIYNSKYSFSNKNYIIKAPDSYGEIITEGNKLEICVGTYSSYTDNHIEGSSIILFIRKKEEPTIPFFTMEIDRRTNEIVQCQGYKHKDYTRDNKVKEFVNIYKKKLNNMKKQKNRIKISA